MVYLLFLYFSFPNFHFTCFYIISPILFLSYLFFFILLNCVIILIFLKLPHIHRNNESSTNLTYNDCIKVGFSCWMRLIEKLNIYLVMSKFIDYFLSNIWTMLWSYGCNFLVKHVVQDILQIVCAKLESLLINSTEILYISKLYINNFCNLSNKCTIIKHFQFLPIKGQHLAFFSW